MQRISLCAGAAAAALVSVVQGQVVVGLDEGGPPVVRVYDPFNPDPPLAFLQPTTPSFSGGVRVAVGDVNGDGVQDLVTGLGPGVPAEFRVYSGTAQVGPGTLMLTSVNTYGPSYTGGVHVAVGDVNGDGRADVITGTSSMVGHVKVFSGLSLAQLDSFFAFGPSYTGGVSVGSGDVNNDGFDDIIVGAGPGAPGGHVKVFSGATGAELASFLAFPGFTGSVSVAGGDVNADGFDDIIVGAEANGHVKVFSGANGAELFGLLPYGGYTGGVRVASGDVTGDGVPEIITGTGPQPGVGPHVKVFTHSGALVASFMAGDPGFSGGVFVAAADSGCYADCTGDGALTIADFGCFQTKFVGGSPYADCNGDGNLTVADFGCFQTRFVQGCP
jgi:FG-GAP-like repeat/FG-GAP repeat